MASMMTSFFSSDEREAGGNEDLSEVLEGSGYGSGSGGVSAGFASG